MLKLAKREQASEILKKSLEKQHYKIVGNHSCVKTCYWTKSMIKGEGGCYKGIFYGIISSQCMQMTTSLSCANRCIFCWRDYKASVSKEWKWDVDDPDFIIGESIKQHLKLLIGLKGYKNVNMNLFNESRDVKHVALSLTGEAIMYPKINEIIKKFHEKRISTFLVTNAQYPEQIRKLKPITQLYISLDAPNKELLKKIDVPLFKDYWDRFEKSLEYMAKKKQRTCIRLTLIKEINMNNSKEYAELIKKADPDFIEAKAYMFLGASRKRLRRENMPLHKDVVGFSKKLLKFLPNYDIVSEHISSRVTLLVKKKFKIKEKWFTWIDFEKFFNLVASKKEFSTEDYLKETPKELVLR